MKTIKKKAWFMALLIGSMALAACGGKENKSSSSQPQSTTPASSEVTPASSESAPVSSESAPVSSEATPASSESAPASSVAPSSEAQPSSSSSSSKSRKSRSSSSEEGGETLPKYQVTIDAKDGSDPVVTELTHGSPLNEPNKPTAPAGKVFYGWMNVENGGQIWDFEDERINVVMGKVTLEPLFIDASLIENRLETELCPDITEANNGRGMNGATYSGGQQGKGLIYRTLSYGEFGISGEYITEDDGYVREATAEDPQDDIFGACVHFNYIQGNTLTYEITSDAAVDNAVIFMRYSAEYGHDDGPNDEVYCNFDDDMFQIKVNGVALEYGEIVIHNVEPKTFIKFQDFYVKTPVSLNAGKNIIELVVNNNDTLNGTIESTAPCIDCLKLYTTSTISFDNAEIENLVRD